MTDKEWYAQLSTLVLEGIDCLNKDQGTWDNQHRIKRFVRDEETPEQRRAEKRRKVFLNVSEAMKWVGYAGGGIMLTISAVAFLACALVGVGFGVPVVMLFMAAALGAMGLAGQIWKDLL